MSDKDGVVPLKQEEEGLQTSHSVEPQFIWSLPVWGPNTYNEGLPEESQ